MTVKRKALRNIHRCFSIWSAKLEHNSTASPYCVSSNNITAGLLNIIFDYSLRHASEINPNSSAIDLVDTTADAGGGIAVHVCSTNSQKKAVTIMSEFCEGDLGDRLCDKYRKLIFLILTTDSKFSGWNKLNSDDYSLVILNLTDLLKQIEQYDLDRLLQILDFMQRELGLNERFSNDCSQNIGRIATILDIGTITRAAKEFTEVDAEKFYMADSSFQIMLRVVSKGQDVPHREMNDRLAELCASCKPTVLIGNNGTGKSTIMLHTAISWVRNGNIALWISLDEDISLTDSEATQFYMDVLSIIPPGQRVLLCLDNPSLWSSTFATLVRNWSRDPRLQILLNECTHRLPQLASIGKDLLHNWLDDAVVVALMFDQEKPLHWTNDCPVEYIPERYIRKHEILKKSIDVMMHNGIIRLNSKADVIRQIMREHNKMNMSLVELIYRAQFQLKDYVIKPDQLHMDWDKWTQILRKELQICGSTQQLYAPIALFCSMGGPINISLYCRFLNINEFSILSVIHKWPSSNGTPPIRYLIGSDALVTRNNTIAGLFFMFHRGTLHINDLILELINIMECLEIEAFLENIVSNKSIQTDYHPVLGELRYRDYLTAICRRIETGALAIAPESRLLTWLCLGLLYTVPTNDVLNLGQETLSLVDRLHPPVDNSVLTTALYMEYGRLLADRKQTQKAESIFSALMNVHPCHIHSRPEIGQFPAKQSKRKQNAEMPLRDSTSVTPENMYSRVELWKQNIHIEDTLEPFARRSTKEEATMHYAPVTGSKDHIELLHAIRRSCQTIQDEPIYRLVAGANSNDMEDLRNRRVRDDLGKEGFNVADQSQRGSGKTGKGIGEVDLMVRDSNNEPWTIIEALRVSNGTKDTWNKHLDKLLGKYNTRGYTVLYLLTYVDATPQAFGRIWTGYQEHIQKYSPDKYTYYKCDFVDQKNDKSTQYVKAAKCQYHCGGYTPAVYHIFARIPTPGE